MNEVSSVSKELSRNNLFHKVEDNCILTRRSIVSIPKINRDIIYLLGILAGDGSITKIKRKRGGYHYSIRIYAEKESFLEMLNKLFKKYFSIEGKIIRDKRKNSTYNLRIDNAAIFFYLTLYGSEIGKKKRFKIPSIVEKDKQYFLEYLSGLIDTDGCVYGKRIQLKQKSYELLKKINQILNSFNLNCSEPKVNFTNNQPYYYIRFDNKILLRYKTNTFLNQKK